jgi:1,2-diacylglycerol 3-beta-galactosyltransferase
VEAARGRLHRFGFTHRVHELMGAADLLLTKPGPGSLAEAFHRRLPVVVTRDARTIPQERFNARFVEEQALGVVAGSWQGMAEAARDLCRDGTRLDDLRLALSRLPENRAVWEILSVLGGIVAGPGAASAAVTSPSSAQATLAGRSEGLDRARPRS